MRSFIAILKNNFRRLIEQKSRLFLFLLMLVGAIAAALFINTKAEMVGHIAVVSESQIKIPSTHLNITSLKDAPAMSELVAGKYDAVVTFDKQGQYEIRTIKNDAFKQQLGTIIADPKFHKGEISSRGSGTNILGFMMMFIFMQGISMMFLFAEDKEKKQMSRIAASPVPFTGYLCAQCIFIFGVLIVPTMFILLAAKLFFPVDMGLSLLNYFFLISLLCLLSTSIAIFIVSLFKTSDTANMIGSACVVLTSVLAGSFYAFDKGNKVLETIIKVLPQKQFLLMSDVIEQGKDISLWYHHGLYLIFLTVIFFAAGLIKTRRDYVKS